MNNIKINQIISNYNSENYGVQANIYKILTNGTLGKEKTGKIIILPVDQGFEMGPEKMFLSNPNAFSPSYFFKLAIEAGFNAFAAPLGLLECGINSEENYIGKIPLILKMNSANSVCDGPKHDQAITSSVKDALRLGCSAIGITIYPGSSKANDMYEEAREIIKEAKSYGLATIVWSYARGENLKKENELALDTICYAAHIASLLGANIIKVKPPFTNSENSTSVLLPCFNDEKIKQHYLTNKPYLSNSDRIAIVKRSAFDGKRLVIFSGGESKGEFDLLNEIQAIKDGGGDGSIVGRNMFQRNFEDAIKLAKEMIDIYQK